MKKFTWTPEADQMMIAARAEGKSAEQIARLIPGMTRNGVLGRIFRLRDKGVIEGPRTVTAAPAYKPEARGTRAPGLAHVPAIKTMLEQGRTDREIADDIGIRPNDVRYVRRIKGWRGIRPAEAARRQAPRVTNIIKGDGGAVVSTVFGEGFMGQQSRLALVELPASGACRFPIDQDGGGVRYCGAVTDEGESYCAHHAARCYMAAAPMRPLKPSHVYGARR
jgi:hypothetical protein